MIGLNIIDILVIIVYFVGITALGVWTRNLIESSDDYFMGNRRFGKFLMIMQGFGVGTHTDQPVSVSGAAYTAGLAGIWYQWLWMFTTPFYWLIAPIYRRLRYVTMADFFEERYGKGLAIFYTIMGMIFFCMFIGLMLKGTGITIEGITQGALSEELVIFIATGLFVLYGLAGGLIAAAVTDAIQGVLILILSFMLIPFALEAAGGIEAIHRGLSPEMFNLVAAEEITLLFIIMVVVNGLFGVTVQPHHMAIGGAGKSEMASRSGWTYGNFMKRFATMGWAFIGVFAAFLYPDLIFEERELAFGIIAGNLLPVGFVGLMVAALAAAVMSSCDAFMVHGSALYTRNVYLRYLNKDASQQDMLKVGRIASLVIVVGGLMFAFLFPSVIKGLQEMWKYTAYLGVAFWFGVVWKKANRYGAIASVLSMAGVSAITNYIFGWTLPYQILAYLPVGIIVMWVVSYFTRPEPKEKLRQFYMLLDTPVGEEQRLKDAGVEIKLEGVSEKKKPRKKRSRLEEFIPEDEEEDGLILVDLMDLNKKFSWKRYRVDILGFLAAAGIVIFLLALMLILAQVGA
ncbi:MAG TPA: sodium:solute symporter family protein [bacterium]|nr:sodium:solute symporter family protein [bacterium]